MPPKKKVKDVHVALSLALSGRTPHDGDIMSIGMCAFTPANRTILGVFQVNLEPQHPQPYSNIDVCGFWNSKRAVVDELMSNRVPAATGFTKMLEFVEPYGKVTLVGNPLMTLYGFLAQGMQRFCPSVTTVPWGFSGICAKSYAAGVLGVAAKDLSTNPTFTAWHEGRAATSLPGNDAVVAAVIFSNAVAAAAAQASVRAAGNSDSPLPSMCPTSPCTIACTLPPFVGPFPTAAGNARDALPQLRDDAPFSFVPYPKIVDPDFLNGGVASFQASLPPKALEAEWVATEKVHGANLSLWTNGSIVRAAKRTGFLSAADAKGFHGFDRVVAENQVEVLALHDAAMALAPAALGSAADKVECVVVFGELAGGEYHHPNVPFDIRGRRVQVGVQYSPRNFFYIFDVAFALPGAPLAFLSVDQVISICPKDATTFLSPQPLARGSFDELVVMAAENPAFQSTIPRRLNLPPLATPNFAEGVVVRPAANNLEVTIDGQTHCAILKRKHVMFKEIQAGGAAALGPAETLFALLTPHRARAVASKHTTAEVADNERFRSLLLDDALEDARSLWRKKTLRGEEVDEKRLLSTHRAALEQALRNLVGGA